VVSKDLGVLGRWLLASALREPIRRDSQERAMGPPDKTNPRRQQRRRIQPAAAEVSFEDVATKPYGITGSRARAPHRRQTTVRYDERATRPYPVHRRRERPVPVRPPDPPRIVSPCLDLSPVPCAVAEETHEVWPLSTEQVERPTAVERWLGPLLIAWTVILGVVGAYLLHNRV
jgi:hypothetical protein